MKTWIAPIVLLLASPVAGGWAALRPPLDSEAVAAFFPPWWSDEQAFQAAAGIGPVTREGYLRTVLVVRVPAKEGVVSLRAAGAWLVADPKLIAACLRG